MYDRPNGPDDGVHLKGLVGEDATEPPTRTRVLKVPLEDLCPMKPWQRRPFADRIGRASHAAVDALGAGQGVLVTCAEERNRSGAIVVAALVQLQGLSVDEAVSVVRARRGEDCCRNQDLIDLVAEATVRPQKTVSKRVTRRPHGQ